ncbi:MULTISPECIES: VOC family protein [unclassified Fusibacter]|uniref:VOC family protein n=1 Tax=unclassified Fusibacter TaxID=2624464 RepID=UPI0013E972D7|nr:MULTISPECIES: VOC family protein [unclassified Fusibacter]MCK8061489.1 VOC family protein [Fusibacter sp. A2]NPE23674.1 hypothetical protein [Fusibacter sp. A1]
MLVPQLYLKGKCEEAIKAYENAFKTKVASVLYDEDKRPENFVVHAEMHIHDQKVMMSDWGGNISMSTDNSQQLVVIFKEQAELDHAYDVLKVGSKTVIEKGPTFYSTCLVDLLDSYGVRWCLMMNV